MPFPSITQRGGSTGEETLETRSAFGTEVLTHFLKGYMNVRAIPLEWIERLPLFLKMRDYTLYGVFHKKVDLANNERENELVAGIRKRLIKDEPIVDLDYRAIWEQVIAFTIKQIEKCYLISLCEV